MSLPTVKELVSLEAKLSARRDLLKDSLARETAALVDVERDIEQWYAAIDIAQCVARNVQEVAHKRIATIVSRCLEAVFDEPYEFRIDFEQKRGRTEANLAFVRDGVAVDPMTASGGGVVDVAAFALRLACIVLAQPPKRRLMVLDEPFKFVSAEYRLRLRRLIEDLSTDFGVQFIVVTHITELEMGKIIRL